MDPCCCCIRIQIFVWWRLSRMCFSSVAINLNFLWKEKFLSVLWCLPCDWGQHIQHFTQLIQMQTNATCIQKGSKIFSIWWKYENMTPTDSFRKRKSKRWQKKKLKTKNFCTNVEVFPMNPNVKWWFLCDVWLCA